MMRVPSQIMGQSSSTTFTDKECIAEKDGFCFDDNGAPADCYTNLW